jgi:hypothetical protein
MFVKTSPLTLVLAVTLSSAVATPSRADDCQTKLDAAMSKITSSGPMRATTKIIINGKPAQETILEFVPPTDTRTFGRTLLQGEDLRKKQELLEKTHMSKFKPDGTFEAYIHIGADTYMGTKKDTERDEDRLSKKPKDLIELALFTYWENYYAKTCGSNKIDYEYNTLGPRTTTDPSDLNREADKKSGIVRVLPTGSVELDANGRPVRIVHNELFSASVQEELKEIRKTAFPGVEFPVETSQTLDISFTYDPALKIEVPK